MVGLGTSVTGAGEDRQWFEDTFQHAAAMLEARSLEHLIGLFCGYLYLDKIEGPNLARLVESLRN